MKKIGIISGTGLEDPSFLSLDNSQVISNKFGQVSSKIYSGLVNEKEVFIISRHGEKHQLSPSSLNYRANIQAFKDLGCSLILAITACGSLKDEFAPGDFVLPDQFIDWTRFRKNTFYEESEIVHTPMDNPFDHEIRDVISETGKKLGLSMHSEATVITIEGPRFSTKAESLFFKGIGGGIINMTTSTEASLANEAKIPYQAIGMVTDYDCWRVSEEPVSMEIVKQIMEKNSEKVISLLNEVIKNIK